MQDIPADLELPPPSPKALRRGPSRERFEVSLKTVTPILGGGTSLRKVDNVEIVRAATIRGHLRFWWRALNAHDHGDSNTLYAQEARVWGRAGDASGGRSPVELRVKIEDETDIDSSCPHFRDHDFYALWPARSPLAKRRKPGLQFRLSVSAPKKDLGRVRDAVRLWILFGGYGSRTRRGLGALTVSGETDGWLPKVPDASAEQTQHQQALRESLSDLFSCSGGLLTAGAHPYTASVPILAGASLLVKFPPKKQAADAWHRALHSLREFRQGAPPARVTQHGHSNWPEADSVRLLTALPKGKKRHPTAPCHRTGGPRWPRAGFGLPFGMRFRTSEYDGDPNPPVQIVWQWNGKIFPRLASPLIVKPLPVRGGFIPMALWLNRADPKDAKVTALQGGHMLPSSDAPIGEFDAPAFDPAKGKSSLREAFLDWLKVSDKWVEI